MKILFVLQHAGYLKHFERALDSLCAEGHSVCLAFHSTKGDLEQYAARLRQAYPAAIVNTRAPRRSDEWADFTQRTRSMRNYLMYFDRRYAGMDRLRAAAARELDDLDRAAVEFIVAIPGARRLFDRLLRVVELAVPTDPAIDAFVAEHAPDIVLVSPLVFFYSPQVDYLKSARRMGRPTALCVASWDNLTNKGQMRVLPDRVIVWNEAQVEEAASIHGFPRRRTTVTGAQTFDQWFEARASCSKADFLRERGLDPNSALILYLSSSGSISPNEIEFVREWHDALRACAVPEVSRAAILVRPHPTNPQPWERLDALALANFAVWPREATGPYDPHWQQNYFDSLSHADAVVGLNTSGQVEAGVVGKPVLTLLSPDYPHTLRGTTDTLHFQHLLQVNGGLLHVARSFSEHVEQLARAIAGDPAMAERSRRFTMAFIRPHGIEQPAAPLLANAIRSLALLKPGRRFLDRVLEIIVTPLVRPLAVSKRRRTSIKKA